MSPQIDVPLSYGIADVVQDPKYLSVVEFNWEPMKEVGVYIKVRIRSLILFYESLFDRLAPRTRGRAPSLGHLAILFGDRSPEA